MCRVYITTLFCCFAYFVGAQYLHTPTEIQQYIDKSKLEFAYADLNNLPEPALPLVQDTWLGTIGTDSVFIYPDTFMTNNRAKKYREKLDNFLEKKKYEKAAELLEKELAVDSANISLYKELAKLYMELAEYPAAIKTYMEILAINHIDVKSREQLADAFLFAGEPKKALDQITMAHLLNRNDVALITKLSRICRANGLQYTDWTLMPQCSLHAKQDTVWIFFRGLPWKSYGNCMALWEYETNYATHMAKLSDMAPKLIQEKECLLNALLTYEAMEQDKAHYPEFAFLAKCLSQGMIDDFILYEIRSRYQPLAMSSLMPQELERLCKFVIHHRTEPL